MDEFKDITPPLRKTEQQIWEDSLFYEMDLFDHLITKDKTDHIEQQRPSIKGKPPRQPRLFDTCFACGQQGHWANKCSKRLNRSREKRKQRHEKWQEKRKNYDHYDSDDYDKIIEGYDKKYHDLKDYEVKFDEKAKEKLHEAFCYDKKVKND
jgi:hypothetical protein